MIALDHYAETLLIDQSRAQREALTNLERANTMELITRNGLSPMHAARLDAALAKRFRYDDGIRTMGEDLAARHARGELIAKKVGNGMIDYSRRRFNAMTAKEQTAYMARLESRRHYYVECSDGFGRPVPKLIYDAIALPVAKNSVA